MKRLAILLILLSVLMTPVSAQVSDTPDTEMPPEIVYPQPVPSRYGYIGIDEVENLPDLDQDEYPPHWAVDDMIAMVSVPRANLRSAPDVDEGVVADVLIWGERFPIVGIYYPGESTVREPETDDFVFDDPGEREVWYLVDTGGGAGWIFGGLVIVANPEMLDALLDRTLTPEEQAYIDSQVAYASNTTAVRYTSRLRNGPGTNFSQVGIIPFQARISIIGRNQYSTWFYVAYNGQQGWLHFELLALPDGFDATAIPIVG